MKLDWKTCFRVGLSIFILYICIHNLQWAQNILLGLLGASFPLIIGACLAYVVNIPMSFYEKHYFPCSTKGFAKKSRRPVCMILAFITVIAIIALAVSLIFPQLVACVQLIINAITNLVKYIASNQQYSKWISSDIINMLSQIDWQSHILKIIQSFTTGVGNVLSTLASAVTYVFSTVMTVIFSVIFSVYLLASKDKLKVHFGKFFNHYLKPSHCERIYHYLSVTNDCFHKYIVGQCVEAVILGVLCTAGLYLLKIPYAATIGALVAFTALIPIAGSYIGAFIGIVILISSPVEALIFLVFITLLQQIEGNIIYPKVVGQSLGLPGIWVLAAVTIGGGMLGIPGMLFGVPIAATIYRLVQEDVNRSPKIN